ncbi:Zn ribbon nucleic-acid-binding protein [Simiduia aestuariiviva]|uniref:Zn ribbon nucleic-acid-binding protein n=2 Tax=Simiduia aestuariiviva TaxID=1510459 RepID=A0A839UTP7_9GAMM|nr:Zn ribbon nucleic-acid-binding protein [Simiduia aestuariiviva]
MMYRDGDLDFRECVACGFKDEMRFKPQVRELGTRVNQPEEIKQADTQVLQFPPLEED